MRPLTAKALAGAMCPPSASRLAPRLRALLVNCLLGKSSIGSERSPRTAEPLIFAACAPVNGLTTIRVWVGGAGSGSVLGATTATAPGIRPVFIS